jgi:formylglycine-generating enzyme required for sulfatase activity
VAGVANYWAEIGFAGANAGEVREETVAVGTLGTANEFGLSDMHGNVAEWCLDTWHASYDGAPRDGSVWEGGPYPRHRVVRGGSWYDYAVNCRSASRLREEADDHDDGTGVRVVVHALPDE